MPEDSTAARDELSNIQKLISAGELPVALKNLNQAEGGSIGNGNY